jgi:hypothetical protein
MSGPSKDHDYENRKKIFEEIKKFTRAEQEELLRILRRNMEEFSENRNGIFFDLLSLRPSTIASISSYVEFSSKNRASFEVREKEMKDMVNTLHT